ncbi:hypothetical protein AO356_26910 [Pseudomonas fluorescens]|uniref:Uncharacterized protein n=1 Tax=Pseudomonas fluorescens TaxID=294 RepID=A0A0N9XFB9_PSEFL|nr:hypothetical protein AO356_26910 [Pseudomonas fluorescens]
MPNSARHHRKSLINMDAVCWVGGSDRLPDWRKFLHDSTSHNRRRSSKPMYCKMFRGLKMHKVMAGLEN